MRILYLGLPLGALALARSGHRPALVGSAPAAAPGARRLRRLGAAGTLVLGKPDLHDGAMQKLLRAHPPDATLVWFWPRRIPAEVLAVPRLGTFGVHPSLLPRWRGPDPYFWTLREGDRQTGVTLHRLEPGYDTGPLVRQRRFAVHPGENAWQLARRLDRPALELLLECAGGLAAGESLAGVPQDPDQVSHAPRPGEADLAIDWQQPADAIVRLVRAAAPFPGATCQLQGQVVEIAGAHVAAEAPPAALQPGEAWLAAAGVTVRAGDAAVVLDRVRSLEGEPVSPARLLGLGG